MSASDVYSWAKASNKPSYTWSEITSKPSTFTPSSHTHDDRYYTEAEVNNKLTLQKIIMKYWTIKTRADGYVALGLNANSYFVVAATCVQPGSNIYLSNPFVPIGDINWWVIARSVVDDKPVGSVTIACACYYRDKKY